MEIEFREIIEVPVKDIKDDPDNPNTMTKQQMDSLKMSFGRFGFLQPVIIDQNNMICDGAHRRQIFVDNGYKNIPCYRINFTNDNERRLLRQVMNKLHGDHDPLLDVKELERLMTTHEDDLRDLLNITHEELDKQKEFVKALDNNEFFKHRSKDDQDILDSLRENNREITKDDFNTHKVVMDFTEEEYEHVNKVLSHSLFKEHKDLYMDLINNYGGT